tara:strand:+ start:125 stop:700 length:576 start_codon:yes stop_codon:yes gene_type:complete
MSAIITSAMLLIGSWHAAYIADSCARCPECCTTQEQVLLEYYVERAVSMGANEDLARELLHVEVLANIPTRLRGMVLAKASHESRFNPRAIGDNGKAVGLLQLWPWAMQFIHDRTDPVASAHVFLGRLVTTERTVHRYCPKVRDRWKLAWIRINRGPFWRRPDRVGEARCSGTSPKGMKVLKRWRREALKP